MNIRREHYLNEINKVIGKQVVKVLLGMRRVGKSTLLKQIQDELINTGVPEERITSINFEWLEFEHLKDYQSLNKYIESRKVGSGKNYVFLDEIQEVSGFEKVVNSLNAKGDTEVFITGSNSRLLSGELATYLTGRFYTVEVLPLSLKEILTFINSRDEALIQYIRSGGMPGKFQFDDDRTAKNYNMDMFQSILLRDIVQRFICFLQTMSVRLFLNKPQELE